MKINPDILNNHDKWERDTYRMPEAVKIWTEQYRALGYIFLQEGVEKYLQFRDEMFARWERALGFLPYEYTNALNEAYLFSLGL